MKGSPMICNNLFKEEKGVSEVLGYILIFGIVITSISIVVVFGFPTLNTARDSADFQKNKNQMQILRSELHELSRGPLRGGGLVFSKQFSIQKGVLGISTKNSMMEIYKDGSLIYSGYIGEINYTFTQKVVGYQNNGLFTKSLGASSSYYLSRPPLQCDLMNSSDAYINFNVINLTGDSTSFSGVKEISFTNNDFNIISESNSSPSTSSFSIVLETNYVTGWESSFNTKLSGKGINYSITTSSEEINITVTNTPNENDIYLNVYETKIGVDVR